jgi:CRISPR-associated endonuclease/helicase Cas3
MTPNSRCGPARAGFFSGKFCMAPFPFCKGTIMDRFFAHSGTASGPGYEDWQDLREHLRAVGNLAQQFAADAVPADKALIDAALAAGLLHDLGKYRPEFQQYIKGLLSKGDPRTFHKQAGAAHGFFRLNHQPIALAVLRHHGGIPDGSTIKADLRQEAGEPTARAVWSSAIHDCPELDALAPGQPKFRHQLHADLFTRVLFSCLVDADWTDTGEHERKRKRLPEEPTPPNLDPELRLAKVLAHIAVRAEQCHEPHIKRIRADILTACLVKAEFPPGLFSLTVPTGGGKTLAGLAFALKHGARHGLRRVIYVAPYMAILEQNVAVFRDALDVGPNELDVFEHYSLAEPPGDDDADEPSREAAARRAENWDAPVVVTTNVQFFESLFSNKPGRCRKLHNIARSVIILDECQTLPPGLVAPTCGMLRQLASDLGSTVVLCTATQPAFNHPTLRDDERLDTCEIIPADLDLFGQLKRVQLTWPKPGDAGLTWANVAERMQREQSALCVVNTKKAARAVYEELKNRSTPGLFHLSTAMCPAHRREKFATIRRLLALGSPCYVVSTQLIEAGVDVDFPFLMRELAPLESVIQAAGRCNREGRIKGGGGRVVVFRSAEGKMPQDEWYTKGRALLESDFLNDGYEPRIDSVKDIDSYFRKLYRSGRLDKHAIQAKRVEEKYSTVAGDYRLIRDDHPTVAGANTTRFPPAMRPPH